MALDQNSIPKDLRQLNFVTSRSKDDPGLATNQQDGLSVSPRFRVALDRETSSSSYFVGDSYSHYGDCRGVWQGQPIAMPDYAAVNRMRVNGGMDQSGGDSQYQYQNWGNNDTSSARVPRQQQQQQLVQSNSGCSEMGNSDGGDDQSSKKVKFLCSFGGKILPRPSDGALRYVGGQTRIISAKKGVRFQELLQRMQDVYGQPVVLKYQLPDEDLDALVTVVCDEDLENMMDEYDRFLVGLQEGSSSKLRLFLFSPNETDIMQFGDQNDSGQQYVEAVNGIVPENQIRRKDSGESASTRNSDDNCGDAPDMSIHRHVDKEKQELLVLPAQSMVPSGQQSVTEALMMPHLPHPNQMGFVEMPTPPTALAFPPAPTTVTTQPLVAPCPITTKKVTSEPNVEPETDLLAQLKSAQPTDLAFPPAPLTATTQPLVAPCPIITSNVTSERNVEIETDLLVQSKSAPQQVQVSMPLSLRPDNVIEVKTPITQDMTYQPKLFPFDLQVAQNAAYGNAFMDTQKDLPGRLGFASYQTKVVPPMEYPPQTAPQVVFVNPHMMGYGGPVYMTHEPPMPSNSFHHVMHPNYYPVAGVPVAAPPNMNSPPLSPQSQNLRNGNHISDPSQQSQVEQDENLQSVRPEYQANSNYIVPHHQLSAQNPSMMQEPLRWQYLPPPPPPPPPEHLVRHDGSVPPSEVLIHEKVLRVNDCAMCQKALPHVHSDTVLQDQMNSSKNLVLDPNFAFSYRSDGSVNVRPPTRAPGPFMDTANYHANLEMKKDVFPKSGSQERLLLHNGQLSPHDVADPSSGAYAFSYMPEQDNDRGIVPETKIERTDQPKLQLPSDHKENLRSIPVVPPIDLVPDITTIKLPDERDTFLLQGASVKLNTDTPIPTVTQVKQDGPRDILTGIDISIPRAVVEAPIQESSTDLCGRCQGPVEGQSFEPGLSCSQSTVSTIVDGRLRGLNVHPPEMNQINDTQNQSLEANLMVPRETMVHTMHPSAVYASGIVMKDDKVHEHPYAIGYAMPQWVRPINPRFFNPPESAYPQSTHCQPSGNMSYLQIEQGSHPDLTVLCEPTTSNGIWNVAPAIPYANTINNGVMDMLSDRGTKEDCSYVQLRSAPTNGANDHYANPLVVANDNARWEGGYGEPSLSTVTPNTCIPDARSKTQDVFPHSMQAGKANSGDLNPAETYKQSYYEICDNLSNMLDHGKVIPVAVSDTLAEEKVNNSHLERLPASEVSADEHIKQELQAVAEDVAASVFRPPLPPLPTFTTPGMNSSVAVSIVDDYNKNDHIFTGTTTTDSITENSKDNPSDSVNPLLPVTEDIGRLQMQIIKNSDLEELQELGSGTFGTVYHGKWRGTDVAIKRINDRCFKGSEQHHMRADFWNEACKLADLHHPNVVAFYGVVLDGPGGTVATVTEYMVNGSLRQALIRNDKILDKRKRLLIAMDVAFGMEYLHSKNIVHFDLKSDNLLVNLRDSQRPICKVGDLGLSKVKRQTLISGGVRGTLPWMAPELLNGSSTLVSEKVDVFSFGIVMWELLTGEEPYADLHYGAIIGGIVSNTLRPPIPDNCDPQWKSLMEKCWSSEPSERPSFTEIADGLRAIASTLPPKRTGIASDSKV